MARSENQSSKLLHLKELFETQSDEDHILSMQDIVSYLAARGIRAESQTSMRTLRACRRSGWISCCKKAPAAGIFLASRPFELAELKLLSGAVQARSFCPSASRWRSLKKLSTLCSKASGRAAQR